MHEEFKEQLKKTMGSLHEGLTAILEGFEFLADQQRWRDPKAELPTDDDTILFWDCGAYVLGHFNPREESWTYYGPIRRFESKATPEAWIPLPKPPKKNPMYCPQCETNDGFHRCEFKRRENST